MASKRLKPPGVLKYIDTTWMKAQGKTKTTPNPPLHPNEPPIRLATGKPKKLRKKNSIPENKI